MGEPLHNAFCWRRNIYALYVIKLAKWLMVIMPVVALFYSDNGLAEFDIYLLQTVYSLSLAILEIPSGYMADLLGRKKTLLLGAILGTAGFILYTLSSTFGGFLAAEIILGIGGSFISGSDTAILFDTLDSAGMRHQYLRFEGRITAFGNLAETVAAIAGGLIAAWCSYRAVYGIQAVIAFIAIPAAIILQEPPISSTGKGKISVTQLASICRYALIENRQLAAAIAVSAITGIATLCMAWTAQIYFVHHNFDERQITPLWVALNLTVAAVSAYAPAISKKIPQMGVFAIICLAIPAGYIALGALPLVPALVSLFLFYGLRGYATPVLKDLTNQFCKSEIRATVFSIRSLIIRTGFALLGPAIGAIAGYSSLEFALIMAGSWLLVCAVIAGGILYRMVGGRITNF